MIYVSDDSQQRRPVNLGTLYRICKIAAKLDEAGPIIYQNRRNDKNIVIPPVLYIGFLSGK